MTKRQFERKHPGVSVQVLHNGKKVIAAASWAYPAPIELHGDNVFVTAVPAGDVASAIGYDEGNVLLDLSRRVLALQSRRVMEEQGGRDVNTGQVAPLQSHHLQHRAHGGTHAKENLAGVSAETHSQQHELKKKR